MKLAFAKPTGKYWLYLTLCSSSLTQYSFSKKIANKFYLKLKSIICTFTLVEIIIIPFPFLNGLLWYLAYFFIFFSFEISKDYFLETLSLSLFMSFNNIMNFFYILLELTFFKCEDLFGLFIFPSYVIINMSEKNKQIYQ